MWFYDTRVKCWKKSATSVWAGVASGMAVASLAPAVVMWMDSHIDFGMDLAPV